MMLRIGEELMERQSWVDQGWVTIMNFERTQLKFGTYILVIFYKQFQLENTAVFTVLEISFALIIYSFSNILLSFNGERNKTIP